MSTDITPISALSHNAPVVSPRPGTAQYLVRITGTGADQYVRSARTQTIVGLGLLGGGMYAALKHANTYWGYAIGALAAGGLLVANAMFNTLGGLNNAARDFARKNFNTQYFDVSQATAAPSSPELYSNSATERSVAKVKNMLTNIKENMATVAY